MERDEDASLEWDYMGDEWGTISEAEACHKMMRAMKDFQHLMTQHSESFKKCIAELRQIADNLDGFHYGATVASITGGAVSAAGGVTSIVGLVLAPFTFGISLIVTGVGLGVATLGGLTSATANISDTVKDRVEKKKVEELVQQYEKGMKNINKCLKGIEKLVQRIESDFEFTMQDLKLLMASAGPRIGKGINNILEIVQLARISKVAGSAAKGIRAATAATGVLVGICLVVDAVFIAMDAIDLRKGAKTESAAKIRQVADELEESLNELFNVHREFEEMLGHDTTRRPSETKQ